LQGGTAWATADAGTDTRAAATTSHFIFRPQGGASGSRAPARLGRSAIARGDHRPRARVPIPPAALFFCLRRQRCCAPLLSHGCSSRTRSPAAGGARAAGGPGPFFGRGYAVWSRRLSESRSEAREGIPRQPRVDQLQARSGATFYTIK
jgi:hypothetical protein